LHELRRVHRNDKERFNIESAALFKEHGVSPLSGCLASLLPLPILLAVYQAERGLTARRAGSMLFVARHVPHGSRLWRALTSASVMRSWGIDLAQTGAAARHAPPAALGLCLFLAVATVIAGICQQRLASRGRVVTNGGAGATANIAPYLSGLTVIWAFALPLAVMLYCLSRPPRPPRPPRAAGCWPDANHRPSRASRSTEPPLLRSGGGGRRPS
jgi:YidC/Oxa1 family membrane protein insertase